MCGWNCISTRGQGGIIKMVQSSITHKRQAGFTLTEVLFATFIMAVGFLAFAEMEFLALRQKSNAETGTTGSNVIQYISNHDMFEMKRQHLYNSRAYLAAQRKLTPDLTYCDNTAPTSCPEDTCVDPCTTCPCNPLLVVTSSIADDTSSTLCSALDMHNFAPGKLKFRTTTSQCITDADSMRTDLLSAGAPVDIAFVVKTAEVTRINGVTLPEVEISISYAVKSFKDFDHSGFSTAVKDTMSRQTYRVTAHLDDWSTTLPTYTNVWVPHLP